MSSRSPSRHAHSEEAIRKCLDEIVKGSSVKSTCNKYGISRSTIRYRLSSKWQKTTKHGPPSVLSKEEEDKICVWIIGMQQRGFPVQRRSLLLKVQEFLSANPRKTPFKNNCPEEVTSASARVSEKDIRNWFKEVYQWLDRHGMSDILIDSSRVFNGDETSFYLHPKTKEVIAQRGSKNVYEVEQACSKQNVTVMFSFSASGLVVNPLVILPGQRIRKEIAQGFPSEWGLGQSERGWMTSHNFGEYMKKVFHPFLLQKGIKLPIILFVDGHSSHVGIEVADLCQQLGVILIALYPNTTRITQPADVSIFKPLKDQWKNEVDDWRSKQPDVSFTLRHFGGVLQEAVAKGIKKDSITNGFRVCGLFPFDAENVDYTKCIAKSSNNTVSPPVVPSQQTSLPNIDTPVTNETADEPVLSDAKSVEVLIGNTSATVTHQLFTSNTDPPTSDVNIPFTVSSAYVPIHKDKIKKAIEVMGRSTLSKIQRLNADLSHEEQVLQYFYKEFIRPFTTFANNSFEDDHIEQNAMVEIEEDDTIMGELLIDNDGNVTISAAQYFEEKDVIRSLKESMASSDITTDTDTEALNNSVSMSFGTTENICVDSTSGHPVPNILRDTTNVVSQTRKKSISEFLKIPPTPRRSAKHRSYTKKYFPVLTAGERIEEIRKAEQEKQENEIQKKIRAAERTEARRRTEEAKKERAEKRKQKKLNEESVKEEKENCNSKRIRKATTTTQRVKSKKLKTEH
ncbi:uncharacterized protein LOC134208226 isoform X2 [Armigeres subalbatus]|uniref:uncharacterized protein LOC134208226 isoform X2 n=1 Tax=Armigeres subalbatus TaxID=124917 RepID=UPI002ED53EA4